MLNTTFNIDFRQIEEQTRYVIASAEEIEPLNFTAYCMLNGQITFMYMSGIINSEMREYLNDRITDRLSLKGE